MENKFNIRPVRPEEAGLVLEFIKKLAAYEKCADEVVADEATLHHSLFVEHSAEVLFAEEPGAVLQVSEKNLKTVLSIFARLTGL